MFFCVCQVCLSDIREETGTYSCFLFVGRFACLISGRRQAPIHAFCLLAGVPFRYQRGDRHQFMLSVCWQVCLSDTKEETGTKSCFLWWQVCLSDIREETGTYSCFLFVGRCACLISKWREAPIHAFCLLAGVPV
jgi:hypothetical protein